jgi:hypothetical protein
MRLSWRRSSDAEDRFEHWIAQQHERRVLAGDTTASGPCPDEQFLLDLARRSPAISLSDPRVDHAATCATCMSRLLVLRQDQRTRGRKIMSATAAAICTVLLVAVFVGRYTSRHTRTTDNAVAVSQTVDLWDAGTVRGEQPGQLQAVSLPAARINLTIVLPRHSAPGQYLVAITRDQSGNGVVAEGLAPTSTNGEKQQISTSIDLSKARAGQYFLSTTHEQDQAAYYYPLQIKR